MTALDPAEIFRAEAAELLACLETTLLDLGDRPEDRTLIDTAFRALHTIKGSGAMFGFEQVAAVLRKDRSTRRFADLVPGAANALQSTTHRAGGLDLDDQVDSAHVDAEFER